MCFWSTGKSGYILVSMYRVYFIPFFQIWISLATFRKYCTAIDYIIFCQFPFLFLNYLPPFWNSPWLGMWKVNELQEYDNATYAEINLTFSNYS